MCSTSCVIWWRGKAGVSTLSCSKRGLVNPETPANKNDGDGGSSSGKSFCGKPASNTSLSVGDIRRQSLKAVFLVSVSSAITSCSSVTLLSRRRRLDASGDCPSNTSLSAGDIRRQSLKAVFLVSVSSAITSCSSVTLLSRRRRLDASGDCPSHGRIWVAFGELINILASLRKSAVVHQLVIGNTI